jgi:autotransporter translocation and assembly factor TamB
MRVPGTRRYRLILLLSLAALAVTMGALLYARARALYRNLGPLVVAEVQRQLGREVAIGRLDTHRFGRVVLEQIGVAAERRLSGGALFRARRIVIHYAWSDLLVLHPDVAGSITRVEIEQPFLLLVREPDGRLNLQKLFKPQPGARPTRFRAPVILTHGRLVFQDYKAALARLPAVNEVDGVDGVVDYSDYPRITARASGTGRRGRAGLIRTTTLIDSTDGSWLVRAFASDADAAYWTNYLSRSRAARVEAGRANVELVMNRGGAKAPLDFVINLASAGLDARLARLPAPLRAVRGVAQVTPYGLKLDASGLLAGMPVQVSGNILDWKQPQVALSARGSGVTLAALRRALPQTPPLPGVEVLTPGTVTAWVLGPVSRLYATGSLVVPEATARGARVRNLQAEWRLHAGMLQLDRIAAEAERGGRLAANGWVQLQPGPPRLYVKGQLEHINLAALPGVSPRTNIGGQASVQFAFSGPPRDLHGGATVQLAHLAFNTARLEAATAHVEYQDGVFYVRSVQAADRRGRLNLAGRVGEKGGLDLQVRARGIDLAALLAPFTKAPASGTAYFTGSIGGTARDPRLAGHLQVYAGRLGAVRTDYAEGQVVLRPDRVATERLTLRIYPGQVALRGSASGWREHRPQLDLSADVQDLSLSRLLAMANLRVRAAGSLSGHLAVRGSPSASGTQVAGGGLRASGALRAEDLLVEGASLGTATARLETARGRLWVREAKVDGEALAATARGSIGLVAPPAQVEARGSQGAPPPSTGWLVGQSSPLDLAFAVQRLDLARVSSRSGARVLLQGSLTAPEGSVRGTVGKPVVTARAEVAPLTVNGVSVRMLSGRGAYTPGQVTLRDVALLENGGGVRISQAGVHLEPGKPASGLTVDARIDSFPIRRLLEIARNSASVSGSARPSAVSGAQPVEGLVSGTITVRPTAAGAGAPTLWTLALDAPQITLPGYRIAATTAPAGSNETQPLSVGLEARATYNTTGHLALDRLALTRDEGVLVARGTMVKEGGLDERGQPRPQGQLALRVDATEIPMGLFGPLAPALHPLRGVGELHLDAEGPLRAPTVQGSVDVDQLALAGVPFTHFAIPFLRVAAPPGGELGSIQIQNARLEVDDKDHPNGQHVFLADGALPFRWETRAPGAGPRGVVPPDARLSLAVRLPEQSLDVLNTLSHVDPRGVNPKVAPVLTAMGGLSAVSGTMSADLGVSGTLNRPDASGSFRITNGAFQPQRGQTRFDQIAVRLEFTGNQIQVQQFEGRSSSGGRFQGSGSISGIRLKGGDQTTGARLNLALALNDVRYTERNLTGYFHERFRGTVRTVDPRRTEQPAPLRLTGDWRAPLLQGAVQVRSARLELPGSLPEPQARTAVFPLNPTFDLRLVLGKDVWLENPRMRLQMAGNLPIRGTMAEPNVTGTLVVERGQMIFPTARFRVEGEVDVAYRAGAETGAAPLRVDLTATSRIRGINPNTGQRQRYDVTLQIRGPLTPEAYETAANIGGSSSNRLTIESRSDPPLSQQQILALIGRQSSVESVFRGGQDAQTALRREVEDTLVASVVPTLFVPLETAIEDWLGLEEFTVDFAFREPLQVRLTRQLFGPFFGTYTRSLNAFGGASAGGVNAGTATPLQNLYTLELYYKLSDRLRVGYRIEEPSRNRVLELSGTFRF